MVAPQHQIAVTGLQTGEGARSCGAEAPSARSEFFTLDANTLTLRGDWVLRNYTAIRNALARMPAPPGSLDTLDARALTRLDTSGASLLADWLGADRLHGLIQNSMELTPARKSLLGTVATATRQPVARAAPEPQTWLRLMETIGVATARAARHTVGLLAFGGLLLQTLVRLPPKRWRLTSMVAQIEHTGFNAVPIVALLSFMVGAVIAFMGATVLRAFGNTLFTVNLVAFAFLREFGILLAAILLAGRTGSAFTAQIGTMQANQEIDALRVQGLNPMEVIVIPRVLALLVSLPILTFLSMLAGLAGGMVVCAFSLDIAPALFLSTLQDVSLRHFWVGMAKAPIFAFLIALIGCRQGFLVSGSADSVGEHTTASVVQAIFTVILFDALAALFYMEMGW